MPLGRRLTLSLRTSMLLVLAVAAWLGWITHKARRQREAVAAVRRCDGTVRYDWQFVDERLTPGREPAAPRWLRRALGDEFFQEVVEVNLFDTSIHEGLYRIPRPVPRELLAHLRDLPRLNLLSFAGVQVTDEGLRDIAGLTGLEHLRLLDAEDLSDVGIAHLAGLNKLKRLDIQGSRMTDLGLARLKGLTGLEHLSLRGSHLTDDGLAHIGGLKHLRSLDLRGGGGHITDAGLAHIEGLKHLTYLGVGGGHITDAGLAHLAGLTELEYLDIGQYDVSDRGLEHLRGLSKLTMFWAQETEVTDEGIKKLQEAVPSLKTVSRK